MTNIPETPSLEWNDKPYHPLACPSETSTLIQQMMTKVQHNHPAQKKFSQHYQPTKISHFNQLR
jgi:hypothetical protein